MYPSPWGTKTAYRFLSLTCSLKRVGGGGQLESFCVIHSPCVTDATNISSSTESMKQQDKETKGAIGVAGQVAQVNARCPRDSPGQAGPRHGLCGEPRGGSL